MLPPRLTILGPGGIGKTSVALSVVADPRVRTVYENRIHWVPCEEATTSELLVELIARSMEVPKGQGGDRKRDIIHFLQPSTQPRLLLIDNFETPWDIPTKQTAVNNVLFDIASVSPLSILLTMRSGAPPATRIRWTKPVLPPLMSLSPEAARQMYLDIHEEAESDLKLDDLLRELAHMPLAVRLMATRGEMGEMPSALLALWKDQRVRTKLLNQGDDRITSVKVSVDLSINSNLMRMNPDALTLLSVLAELPGGARQDFIQSIAPSIIDCSGALCTLRRAALVQTDPSTQQIHILSPIRSLVLQTHRAPTELRSTLLHAYFDLVHKYDFHPGEVGFFEALPILTLEAENIESLLLDAIEEEPSGACIEAVYTYSESQSFTTPRVDMIERAIVILQSRDLDHEALCRALALEAEIYRKMGRFSDAAEAAERGVSIARCAGDQHGEAKCLHSFGEACKFLGRYEDALDAARKARSIYRDIGDQTGEANCLHSIGELYLMLDRWIDAVKVAYVAYDIHLAVGNLLGQANSLTSLGSCYIVLGDYDTATRVTQQAGKIFQHIGYQLGEATCYDTLSDSYRAMGRYDEALDAAQKALRIHTSIGSQLGEADSRLSLGHSYAIGKRYEDAIEAIQQARSIYQRIGQVLGEANCLGRLAYTYRKWGRCSDAVPVAREALIMYLRAGRHIEVEECRALLEELGDHPM